MREAEIALRRLADQAYFTAGDDAGRRRVTSDRDLLAAALRGAGPSSGGVTVTEWRVEIEGDPHPTDFRSRADDPEVGRINATTFARRFGGKVTGRREVTSFPDHTTDWQEVTP